MELKQRDSGNNEVRLPRTAAVLVTPFWSGTWGVCGDLSHMTCFKNQAERRRSLVQARSILNDYDMGLPAKTRAVLEAVAHEVNLNHRLDVSIGEIEAAGGGWSDAQDSMPWQ